MTMSTTNFSDRAPQQAKNWASVAMWTAAVAGVFVAVVLAILVLVYVRRLVKDPLDSGHFQDLKVRLAELKKQPVQEEIDKTIADIRAEDFRLRQEYFWERRFAARGAWLLLGGMAVLLVAAKSAATLRRKLPTPEAPGLAGDPEALRSRVGRWSVAGLGLLVVAAMLALNSAYGPNCPQNGLLFLTTKWRSPRLDHHRAGAAALA